MKCPRCQIENEEPRRFCRKCGARLSILCLDCGFENLPGDDFCGGCGKPLGEQKEAAALELSRPRAYTPKHLADKILTTRSSIEGERKLVTVLFADVANFTSISEKLDPEEVHQIMDGCFKVLMDEIHRYEGTINQFTGDGVMVLFGAPVAHEDHAQRACHAALSIQEAIKGYGEKLQEEKGIEFRMRIGLNSGPVIVGAIGDDLRMDYTAVGDTTNLAARMESIARPGAILVSWDTYRLARGFFEFVSLGKVKVKGKKESQEAFELVRTGEVETRIEASIAKGLTRFVGRKNSKAALRKALEKADAGSGQVVGIVGEAGVGKSRLLLEFRSQVPQSECTYLEGRCVHYGTTMPYLPILDALRSYFEIKEAEQATIIRRKMEKKVVELDEKLLGVLPPYQDLFSLKVKDEQYSKLQPKQKRERVFEALRDLFIRESQERVLVIAVDDLHWIDKTTEEFLDYLIGWLASTRILLILLYRPGYTHHWGSKSYFTKVGLDQLGTESSSELVKAILEERDVDLDLTQFILNRAAGNPLFLEEFTHTLLENGSIERKDEKYVLNRKASDINVPDTIQGIIAARMDRLDDNLKRIMQVASVIGRDFAFRILQSITGMRDELKSYLLNLQGMEFIYEKRLFPELEYIFKHALIQEVAYNSLLQKRRKGLHEQIGKAIEQIYADKLEGFYAKLGYHYSKSKDHKKAYYYLVQAGDSASRLYAYADARLYYAQALEALDRLPDTNENRRGRVDLLIKQVGSSWRSPSLEQNTTRLTEAQRLAKELPGPDGTPGGDRLLLARVHFWIGRLYYVANRMPEAIGYFLQVLEVAKGLDDPELPAMPSLTIGVIRVVQGHLDKGIELLSKAILASEQLGKWSEWIRAKGHRSYALAMSGKCASGVAEAQRAVARAEEINYLGDIAESNIFLSVACLYAGDLHRAIEAGREGAKAGEESQERIFACLGNAWRGWAEGRAGDFGAAAASLARSQAVMPEFGGQVIAGDWIAAIKAEIALGMGRIEEALALTERAIRIAQKMDGIFAEGLARQVQGKALAALDPPRWNKAEAQFAESLRLLESGQHRIEAARTNMAWGSVCRDRGNLTGAREHWKLAAVQFETSGLTKALADARALIADVRSE